jgi:hypothetical protein
MNDELIKSALEIHVSACRAAGNRSPLAKLHYTCTDTDAHGSAMVTNRHILERRVMKKLQLALCNKFSIQSKFRDDSQHPQLMAVLGLID